MTDTDQLGTILGDLIEVLHRQAKELEKLVAHDSRNPSKG